MQTTRARGVIGVLSDELHIHPKPKYLFSQIGFRAIRGSEYSGDIALDKMAVSDRSFC